jgi:hypothetical protein
MRKIVVTLGTLFIVAIILISGTAVATWVWADHAEAFPNTYCSNPSNAAGAPDGNYASLGFEGPPPELGWILLDLTSTNAMGPNQEFLVVAYTSINETYDVSVSPDTNPANTQYVGSGWDTENLTFTTPSQPFDGQWRYILIQGTSGITALLGGDFVYGPDIDAVGWDK